MRSKFGAWLAQALVVESHPAAVVRRAERLYLRRTAAGHGWPLHTGLTLTLVVFPPLVWSLSSFTPNQPLINDLLFHYRHIFPNSPCIYPFRSSSGHNPIKSGAHTKTAAAFTITSAITVPRKSAQLLLENFSHRHKTNHFSWRSHTKLWHIQRRPTSTYGT